MKLNELRNNSGARKKPKLVGRGPGTGHGKTSCRGHKGASSRSGNGRKPGFEGGQMPLYRRLPKRGFTNIFAKVYDIINVETLNKFSEKNEVTPEVLSEAGLVKSGRMVKILATGELKSALKVTAHKFSKSAKEKIEKAGGSIVLIVKDRRRK